MAGLEVENLLPSIRGCAMPDDTKLSFRTVFTKAGWGISAVVGAAILTWTGNFLTGGGVIRAMGGLPISEFTNAEQFQVDAKCGAYENAAMGDAKSTFCFLSDVSIRQDNTNGWDACKIEVGNGDNAGRLLLTGQMTNGTCAKGAEISCKAKCIRF